MQQDVSPLLGYLVVVCTDTSHQNEEQQNMMFQITRLASSWLCHLVEISMGNSWPWSQLLKMYTSTTKSNHSLDNLLTDLLNWSGFLRSLQDWRQITCNSWKQPSVNVPHSVNPHNTNLAFLVTLHACDHVRCSSLESGHAPIHEAADMNKSHVLSGFLACSTLRHARTCSAIRIKSFSYWSYISIWKLMTDWTKSMLRSHSKQR